MNYNYQTLLIFQYAILIFNIIAYTIFRKFGYHSISHNYKINKNAKQ